jgi:UPF0755 protein
LCYNGVMQIPGNEYRIEQPRLGLKRSFFLLVLLILVIALVVGIYYFTKVNRAATSVSREVNFTIEKGLSTKQIAAKLAEQEIINNEFIFVVYSKLNGAGSKFQAGNYILNSNMTPAQIVEVLTLGKVVTDHRFVTIIEGMSNKQLAKFLVSRQIIQTELGLDKALGEQGTDFKFFDEAKKFAYQGFLFPDTYTLIKEGSVATDLVSKMLNNFESKITDQMIEDVEKSDYDFGQILTLASIIEKEVGRNKENITDEDIELMQRERELVASVFYNRLEIDMALESDATVNYVTGKSDRSVTIEDTKINSPFNTYRFPGLPPTPISNPGLDSIHAAINPASSDYLFFLNSPDGTAYFAKTLAEHGVNREKYLR